MLLQCCSQVASPQSCNSRSHRPKLEWSISTWWWKRLSWVDLGKRGYSATTKAATASSLVEKVVLPPPMNRNPSAMLMAMWLPWFSAAPTRVAAELTGVRRLHRPASRSGISQHQ